jgi:hypothetical protein
MSLFNPDDEDGDDDRVPNSEEEDLLFPDTQPVRRRGRPRVLSVSDDEESDGVQVVDDDDEDGSKVDDPIRFDDPDLYKSPARIRECWGVVGEMADASSCGAEVCSPILTPRHIRP